MGLLIHIWISVFLCNVKLKQEKSNPQASLCIAFSLLKLHTEKTLDCCFREECAVVHSGQSTIVFSLISLWLLKSKATLHIGRFGILVSQTKYHHFKMHFVFNQFIIVKNENLFDEFVTSTKLQKTKKLRRWQTLFSSTVCGSLSNLIHLENTRSLRVPPFFLL